MSQMIPIFEDLEHMQFKSLFREHFGEQGMHASQYDIVRECTLARMLGSATFSAFLLARTMLSEQGMPA